MTRREILGAAVVAAPFASADPPTAPKTGPAVEQLINLAEHGWTRSITGGCWCTWSGADRNSGQG